MLTEPPEKGGLGFSGKRGRRTAPAGAARAVTSAKQINAQVNSFIPGTGFCISHARKSNYFFWRRRNYGSWGWEVDDAVALQARGRGADGAVALQAGRHHVCSDIDASGGQFMAPAKPIRHIPRKLPAFVFSISI
jgi:hypothetical protein